MAVKKAPDQVTGNLTGGTLTSDQFLPAKNVPFAVIVSGTFVANVRLRVSYDGGATFNDVFVFTAPDMVSIKPKGMPLFVLDASGGGDYTSGTATVFMGTN